MAVALGLLTKYTSIVALFAATGLLLLTWRRQRLGPALVARRMALLVGPAVLLGAGWFARNLAEHGRLFVLQHDKPIFPKGVIGAIFYPEELVITSWMVLREAFVTYVGPLWLFWEWMQVFRRLCLLWIPLWLWPIAGWVRRRRNPDRPRLTPEQRLFVLAGGIAVAANVAGVINTCLFE